MLNDFCGYISLYFDLGYDRSCAVEISFFQCCKHGSANQQLRLVMFLKTIFSKPLTITQNVKHFSKDFSLIVIIFDKTGPCRNILIK
jgi:hypothetical protein